MRRAILAVFLTLTIVATPITGSAAAAPGLNFSSEKAPNPTFVEDELVVGSHDRSEMSDALEYYNDSGEVATLPATVNQSQDTPVGVRFDQIDAERYGLFPRIDGETGNSANWTVASDWTTSSGASSSMSVTDADADGVDKLELAATVASSETATATYADNVSITSDPNKRVMFGVLNVDTLASGSTVEVRAVDGDGDYRYAEVNASANASADDVIANSTGNGYVFSERLSNLPLAGSGDGTFDSIQQVDIVASDADATVTLAGLDLDTKSDEDLAEIQRNTDGDTELEATTITDYYEGGVANLTALDTLGPMYDDAVVNDLHVYDVQYQFSDLSDSEEYSTEFSSADDYNYPQKLELYADMSVPTAIDLQHGSLTMEFEQGLVESRYVVAEVATGVDSSEEFGNFTDEDGTYSSVTDSFGSQGTTATFVASASADTNYRVHLVVLLQDEEASTLQDMSAVGPTGASGGGFFASIWGKVAGLLGSVLVAVGLKRKVGGS
ncbi:hypothetical protein [Haloarcula amylovorans]|uniref:hypothetical protein n=1 Tax=Haloarcula amylovorans TaxID=2562280 RepID=UPI001075CE11|nr:hypothetical protein [Halomicroarcula amylolytica]